MKALTKILIKLSLAGGIIALAALLILKNININDAIAKITRLSWVAILGMLLMVLIISISKTWRFYLLCKKSGLKVSWWQALKIFFSSQATTPLPGGEVMRGILLKLETHNTPIEVSGPVVAQAFMEVISAIVIVIIGSIFYRILLVASLILVIILLSAALFIAKPDWVKKFTDWIGKWHRVKKYATNVTKAQQELTHILFGNKIKVNLFLIEIFGISLLSHIIGGLLIYFISITLGIAISLLFSIFLYAATVVIVGLLGAIPGGVGVTEGGMLGLLRLYGISLTQSTILIILFRFWTLVFPIVLGLVLMAIFYGKQLLLVHRKK
jgi:uncharacterized protein (TIRG00374 family)